MFNSDGVSVLKLKTYIIVTLPFRKAGTDDSARPIKWDFIVTS